MSDSFNVLVGDSVYYYDSHGSYYESGLDLAYLLANLLPYQFVSDDPILNASFAIQFGVPTDLGGRIGPIARYEYQGTLADKGLSWDIGFLYIITFEKDAYHLYCVDVDDYLDKFGKAGLNRGYQPFFGYAASTYLKKFAKPRYEVQLPDVTHSRSGYAGTFTPSDPMYVCTRAITQSEAEKLGMDVAPSYGFSDGDFVRVRSIKNRPFRPTAWSKGSRSDKKRCHR